jgi:hypothetical protein
MILTGIFAVKWWLGFAQTKDGNNHSEDLKKKLCYIFTMSTDMVILELVNLFKTFYLGSLWAHSELLLHDDLSLNLFIVYLHFYLCDFFLQYSIAESIL